MDNAATDDDNMEFLSPVNKDNSSSATAIPPNNCTSGATVSSIVSPSSPKSAALVFGANSEQGRAVVEGLLDAGYNPVYAFTRCGNTHHNKNNNRHASILSGGSEHMMDTESVQYLRDGLGATVIIGDLQNPMDVQRALRETAAKVIFLATTTELPTTTTYNCSNPLGIATPTTTPTDNVGGGTATTTTTTGTTTTLPLQTTTTTTAGFSDAAEDEYQVIVLFFQLLAEVYQQDKIARHVVFAVRDNVQEYNMQHLQETGDLWITPLEDGSVVPHFTAKGKGGVYAVEYLQPYQPDLKLTLLTLPFLYSNFLGFFAPLPDETGTQWMLSACFGDGQTNKIDMMSASDLATIVPNILARPDKYNGKNIRLAAEQLSMDDIAAEFSDLFGKDVIYNPLTVEEFSHLPFASAPCMAQMCQFLGDPRSLQHDLAATAQVCFPKRPQTFRDWLLSHSGSSAYEDVGLTLDAPDILTVTVFGATSPEGRAVVLGLLADVRKSYHVRATSRHVDADPARAIAALDPDRVELVYADFNDVTSCQKAVQGADGAFLVTDFYQEAQQDMDLEEQHAKNVIDACEASTTVKHLVFSTMESVEKMNRILYGDNEELSQVALQEQLFSDEKNQFDAKARAAAYARTKRLSVTYVLMPCYSELFFDLIERRDDKLVLTVPLPHDQKVMCMSVEDLGPAVANIFDSYQVYAGHEVGLVTDFCSVAEVRDMIEQVFLLDETSGVVLETEEVSAEQWALQAKDTYMKDLGQMFRYMAHSDAVKQRRSVAKTLKLVPSARPLRHWVQQNVDNAVFREKLGLR